MKKLVLFLLLFASRYMFAQATALTGTLKNPDGTGFNGQLILSLAQQASIASTNNSSGSACGGPLMEVSTVQKIITVTNGALIGSPSIYGSDCTLPYGVPYNVIARDNNGNVDFTAQWLPMGNSQNIGTIESVLNPLGTLFGLSLSDLALTSAANTFSANQTFSNNITVGGSITVGEGIYGNPGSNVSVYGNGGAYDFEVFATNGAAVFEIGDNGNVIITNGYLNTEGAINSNTGFTYQGSGGTSGQCLVSNGTEFVPNSCTATIPTLYYQTTYGQNTPLTQRPGNNFVAPLTAVDNPGGNVTNISMTTSGVTAGTYGYPASVTVDTYGRVTSITGGSSSTQVIKTVFVGPPLICTTQASAYSSCPTGIVWPTPFADTNGLVVSCSPGTPTNSFLSGFWVDPSSITTTGVTAWIQNGDASAAHSISVTGISCIGIHP